MVFEDKEGDKDNIVNPSISAQTHSSSNRNIVASVHQSNPIRRKIQANTSAFKNSEESKYQDPEERGLLYVATHKMTKSNGQIDVNNAFSKAVEKKSTGHITWDNDIEQPTTQRPKKTQIRVNMASRKKVVFKDDGTIVEFPDNEAQDTSSSQVATTPHTAASAQSRTHAAIRSNGARPRHATTVQLARGRGRGRTPGSHYFGAGGQCYTGGHGGRNSQASAPDGRAHLIPRSTRNTPPQQTVSKQYIPGVNTPLTQQAQLNRRMAETNLTTSYVARSHYQLPTNNTTYSQQNWLNMGSIPDHTGIREDGTFDGLDGDANSRAFVPYDVRPDPIVSQQTIVAATPGGPAIENSTNTLAMRQSSCGLRTSASNFARHTAGESPTPEVLFREGGTMYGPSIDEKDEDKAMIVHQDALQDAGSIIQQDDPQDADLKRGANVDPKRGAIADPKTRTSARKASVLVATDTLLESTDPRHQPGSVTAHHRAPSPKRGLVDNPQDDGQERGAQVDLQPIPASNSDTGTSMQDIDEDDDKVHNQVQIPEIPANWKPPPPSLSHISQELGNDADTSSMGLVTWRPGSPVVDADGLLVEENHRDQPPQQTFQGHDVDTSSLGLTVWRPDSPAFDDEGLPVEGIHRDQSSQQTSRQGDLEEASTEDDGKIPALVPFGQGNTENSNEMPRLVRDPNREALNQNPYAALADDSGDEALDTDVPRPNNTDGTEDQGPRTCASVASSSSGSDDAGNQPSFAKLTRLPNTGMCQRRPHADTQSNKRDRTPKTKRAPKGHAMSTPSSMASIARDACTDILSPLVGDRCEHNSSEEVSPTNSNDPELEE